MTSLEENWPKCSLSKFY